MSRTMRLRLLSFLSISLLAILLPHTYAQQTQDSGKIPVSNYLITGCSAILPSTHDTKTALLTSLLREIDADLPTLIVEANTGTDSNYGFTSLFTSDDAIETVTATYGKISDGAPVVLSDGVGEKQVTFQCLEKNDPVTGAFLAQLEAQQPRAAAYNAFGQETIYLLPFFFTELLRSPAPYRCPLFRQGRIAINGDDILGSTQYGTIIHELVDKYLHLNGIHQPERYNLREVIGDQWDEAGKVQNAENYDFFASSLKAGCTGWPK